MFVIKVDNRLKLYEYLRKNGINCQVHYIPVYKMPYYKEKFKMQKFPDSDEYYSKCLSIPIYPSLSEIDQNFIINKILKFNSRKWIS